MQEFDPIADLFVCEQTSPADNTVSSLDTRKAGGDTVARFDTTLQSFEVMNRNGRQYLGDNVWSNILTEENQTLIRGNRWFGEQDHPFNTTEAGKCFLPFIVVLPTDVLNGKRSKNNNVDAIFNQSSEDGSANI